MKNLLFFCFAVMLIAMSCGKEDYQTIVQGRVLEENSQKPVAFARVKLLSGGSVALSNAAPNTTDEVIADENGFYQMEFEWNRGSWYEVLPQDPKRDPKKKYFAKSLGTTVNTWGTTNNIDCSLIPYAYLKLRVKNVNPFDELDRIALTNSYSDGIDRILLGTRVDTTILGYREANQPNAEIIYFVTKNSIKREYRIAQSFAPHDTITYNINY